MHLLALPAFDDNYIWILHDGAAAVVVDPGDAAPVMEALRAQQLALAAVLITHHHADHVGGLDALYQACGSAATQVYLPVADGVAPGAHASVPASAIHFVQGDDHITLLGSPFRVIDVPGHTAGHVAYASDAVPGQPPLLFCGDTLFSGGCGRLFEGTPAQMLASLDRLAALPARTLVCCAHEYTLSNLRFALAAEPDNAELADYLRQCEALRAEGKPTVPSTIGRELQINPFLRVREPALQQAAQAQGAASTGPVDTLAALREWKNRF